MIGSRRIKPGEPNTMVPQCFLQGIVGELEPMGDDQLRGRTHFVHAVSNSVQQCGSN